jgi:hypothetical protein
MTRAEHVAWAKQRALEYVEQGDFAQAIASIVTDYNNHEETSHSSALIGIIGIGEVAAGADAERMRRFIEGCN